MSPTASTFLFELVNALLLALMLWWILFKPVREALQAKLTSERERAEALTLREAQVTRSEATAEARRLALETDLRDLRTKRVASASAEAEGIIEAARRRAAGERDAATRQLAHMEEDYIRRLANAVAEAAGAAVSHLLHLVPGPEMDVHLLHAAAEQLAHVPDGALALVVVESARPLPPTDRAGLEQIVAARGGRLEFVVHASISGGVRLITNAGMIDASIDHLGREAERLLRGRLLANDFEVAA